MQDDVEVLKRARALVNAGWIRGHWEGRSSNGGVLYCLGGAILVAAGYQVRDNTCPTIRAFNMAAFGEPSFDTRFIVQFNDAGGRTKEEVLALLDKVIIDLEAGRFMKRLIGVEPLRARVLSEPSPWASHGMITIMPHDSYLKPAQVIHVEHESSVVY